MCQAAAGLLKAMQLLSKDFPEGPRSCVGTHLTLVLGLDERAKVGEGSSPTERQRGRDLGPLGPPRAPPAVALCCLSPGVTSPRQSAALHRTPLCWEPLPPSPLARGHRACQLAPEPAPLLFLDVTGD